MVSPTRFLFVSSHPVQYAAPLYRALAARPEADVRVVFRSLEGAKAYFDRGYGQTVRLSHEVLDGFEWSSLDTPRSGWKNQLLVVPRLVRAMRREEFDVLVVDSYRSVEAVLARRIAARRGARRVLLTDAIRPGGARSPVLGRVARAAFRRVLRRSDAVGCMSTRSAKYVSSLGAPLAVARVVCFDSVAFPPADRPIDLSGQLRVLWVGRMLDWKRVDRLIAAMSDLDGVVLRLVGSGPEEERLRTLAGRNSHIEFVGRRSQSDLAEEYRWAHVLAIPSDNEPFGVVAIEASAFGTPLLVDSTAGSAGDVVTDFEAGWIVDGDNWRSAIIHLRDKRDEIARASEASHRVALEFLPERAASRLIDALAK